MITVDSGLIALFLMLAIPTAGVVAVVWIESRKKPSSARRAADLLAERWGWTYSEQPIYADTITPTERQILAADKAARLRVANRLIQWAEASVESGKRHKDDPEKRAKYGAQARALYAAAREILRHDRPSDAP